MDEENIESDGSLMETNGTAKCMSHDTNSESRESIQHDIEGENRSCDSIKHNFHRLFLVFKICGLMFDKDECSRLIYSLQVALFSLLLGVSWGNVIRYIAAYEFGEQFSPILCIKIVNHTIYVLGALTHTAFLPLSLSQSSVLARWQEYHEKHNVPSTPIKKKIEKQCVVGIIVWLLVLVSLVLLQALEQYSDSPFGLYTHRPFANDYKHLIDVPTVNKVVVASIYLLMENVFCLYFAWFMIVALALKKEFEVLATSCKWASDEIETLRQRHFELSSIVSDVNGIVSPFILAIFVCCVPALCFNIYMLVVWNLPVQYKPFLLVSLLIYAFVVFSIVIVAAQINIQACSFRTALYKLDLTDDAAWTQQHIAKVILWLISYSAVLVKFGSGETIACEQQVSHIGNETSFS